MLKVRLQRTGRRNKALYRLVVAEHTAPVKGKFLEIVGHYNPIVNPKILQVQEERIRHWISVGAKPTDTVASLLKAHLNMPGMEAYIQERNKKRKKKKQNEAGQAPVPAAKTEPVQAAKTEPVEAAKAEPVEAAKTEPAPAAKTESAPAEKSEKAEAETKTEAETAASA